MPQSAQPILNRAPAPENPMAAKAAAKKKSKRKFPGTLLLLLAFVLIAGAFVSMVYFDVAGFKGKVVSALKLDAAVMAEVDKQQAQALELEQKQNDLNTRSAELDKLATTLQKREDAVAQKEATLKEAEQAVESSSADIAELAALLENMDAAKAAAAIGGMTQISDIARLLTKMDSAKAALILGNLDTALATEILTQMMRNS